MRVQKAKIFNLRFLYSQDLSNCTTKRLNDLQAEQFLYSQDLSNCTTLALCIVPRPQFLYSQDLSNCTTDYYINKYIRGFCTLKI